jgi:glutaredoxin-like protein
MLGDGERGALEKEFGQRLVHPVRLVVFSQTLALPGQEALVAASEQAERLAREVASLHPKLSVEGLSFVGDRDRVSELEIERIPAIAVLGEERDYGIRFYGRVEGYEFGTLVDAILTVSAGESGLAKETREALAALDKDVRIRVFSTPTCPYCPGAVKLAYQFAMESAHISADGVEVTGYPDLAQRYRISGVPKTVVGESEEFVGAQPEATLLEHVQRAAA